MSDKCGQGKSAASSSSLKSSTPKELSAPLAEVMRPSSIDEYVGQEGVIGKNTILRSILESGQVPSLIFWGPPGCGKVTLTDHIFNSLTFDSTELLVSFMGQSDSYHVQSGIPQLLFSAVHNVIALLGRGIGREGKYYTQVQCLVTLPSNDGHISLHL